MNNTYQGSYMTNRLQLFFWSVLVGFFGADSLEIKDDKFILIIKNKTIDLTKSQIISIKEMKYYLSLGKSFMSSDTIKIIHHNQNLPNPLIFVSRSNELITNLRQHSMIV